MNSEGAKNGVSKDILSGSHISNNATNTNITLTTDESKGAIPKTKFVKVPTKKTNNNNNNVEIFDSSGFPNDLVKRNGYVKPSTSANYLTNTYSSYNLDVAPLKERDLSVEKTSLNIPVDAKYVREDGFSPLESHNTAFVDLNQTIKPDCFPDEDLRDSDDSSSEDNELLSVSDDGCIYTYKGDQVADLPSSFFSLEFPVEDPPGDRRAGKLYSIKPNMTQLNHLF